MVRSRIRLQDVVSHSLVGRRTWSGRVSTSSVNDMPPSRKRRWIVICWFSVRNRLRLNLFHDIHGSVSCRFGKSLNSKIYLWTSSGQSEYRANSSSMMLKTQAFDKIACLGQVHGEVMRRSSFQHLSSFMVAVDLCRETSVIKAISTIEVRAFTKPRMRAGLWFVTLKITRPTLPTSPGDLCCWTGVGRSDKEHRWHRFQHGQDDTTWTRRALEGRLRHSEHRDNVRFLLGASGKRSRTTAPRRRHFTLKGFAAAII